jgi:hypothetical protein
MNITIEPFIRARFHLQAKSRPSCLLKSRPSRFVADFFGKRIITTTTTTTIKKKKKKKDDEDDDSIVF